ncbi:MAG: helix-turn-helix transcriptional regulator [Bacteroidota bacterium]
MREGNGAYWLDHVRTEQQLNNLYLIPPDTPYAWRRDAGLDAFLLYFSPDLLPPGQNKELILLSEVGIDANTHQWASQMLTRFFRDQAAGTNALVRNLPEFLATLHRKIITGSLVNPTYQRHFLAYRTLLAETATPHATVRKYAFRMGLSPNHLNAICQKVAGRTAKDLAQEQRQRKAAQLLANPSYSLRQIGQLLGFADPANFTRFWRERTGDSPSNFRRVIVDLDK